MPLSFHSLSAGDIAFGFFNIETDLLLLQECFFFAPEFCAAISGLAGNLPEGEYSGQWPGYRIEPREHIGDLMGAIHGIRHTGFIGDVYRKFPFPQEPQLFKQNPDGFKTRPVLEDLLEPWAEPVTLKLAIDPESLHTDIAGYTFTPRVFHQLLNYVWRGGYPQWTDNYAPADVRNMKNTVQASTHPLLKGIQFD
ncbi:MAG: hypothetical protein HKM93_18200 [Desulfobacteraceae bacterium]|nr:hypothetical protein [Desulfobacteraceae bacterium]